MLGESHTNGSSKERIEIHISERYSKNTSSDIITTGSEKESFLTLESDGSVKEMYISDMKDQLLDSIKDNDSSGSSKETNHQDSAGHDSAKELLGNQSEDADIPSLDRISGSDKELER